MTKSISRSLVKLTSQALLSQWTCPVSHDARYLDFIFALCEDVDSSLSMRVYWSIVAEDYDKLVSITCDPGDYENNRQYYCDNLLVSFIKKYPYWPTSINPREEAIKTFIACELECAKTNARLSASASTFDSSEVPQIISIATRKIADILGDVPAISSLPFEFGPGATFTVKRQTTAVDKLAGALDVTPEATEQAVELLQNCPGWLSLHGIAQSDKQRIIECLSVIPGDRLSFVPKTAKTDRPIAIGPTLNVLIQKGFGSFIRKRLKKSGLNLNRLPDRHRMLAQQGSIDGSVSTIDLSSASDTISWGIVAALLPPKWLDALHACRCGRYQFENKWFEYHKFSAMGNGYTFELESLIFYALAFACAQIQGLDTRMVSSFGDDIIIPTGCEELLMQALSFCGFTVNKEKSFTSGPFRESCGGDFFHGISVRGFYVKDRFRLFDIVRFRNYLYRTGYRFWFRKTWRLCRYNLKDYEQYLAGPDDGTDDHIVFDDYDHGRSFNFISMGSRTRRLPRRWHLRRVWMLYEAMSIRPPDLFGNLSTSAPTLSNPNFEVIGISTRYIRKFTQGNLPWEVN